MSCVGTWVTEAVAVTLAGALFVRRIAMLFRCSWAVRGSLEFFIFLALAVGGGGGNLSRMERILLKHYIFLRFSSMTFHHMHHWLTHRGISPPKNVFFSVKISDEGRSFDGTSSLYEYLIAKCPCVVGCLWMVTDGEIDRFFIALIEHCFSGSSKRKSGGGNKDLMSREAAASSPSTAASPKSAKATPGLKSTFWFAFKYFKRILVELAYSNRRIRNLVDEPKYVFRQSRTIINLKFSHFDHSIRSFRKNQKTYIPEM